MADYGYRNTDLVRHHHKVEKCPNISKPIIVGYFSVDGNREHVPNAEQLKYLVLPKKLTDLKLDLNCGYENVIHKPESVVDERLYHILKYIVDNKKSLCVNNADDVGDDKKFKPKLDCDFISFRGLLRTVMCTPFEYKDDWCILATKFNGNIYLCQIETEDKKRKRLAEDDYSKRICSYGFKFEQYILKSDPSEPFTDNTDEPVNESEEFTCVYKREIDGIKLLFAAEMDGVKSDTKCDINPDTDLNKFEFVEVKVRLRQQSHGYQELNFKKHGSRKWWSQNFLVGGEEFYVGWRNDKGIIDEIKEMKIDDVLKEGQTYWSSNSCLDFLKRFLITVQNDLKNVNCPYTVYEYYWTPRFHKAQYKIYRGKNNLTFLPDWYITEMK